MLLIAGIIFGQELSITDYIILLQIDAKIRKIAIKTVLRQQLRNRLSIETDLKTLIVQVVEKII